MFGPPALPRGSLPRPTPAFSRAGHARASADREPFSVDHDALGARVDCISVPQNSCAGTASAPRGRLADSRQPRCLSPIGRRSQERAPEDAAGGPARSVLSWASRRAPRPRDRHGCARGLVAAPPIGIRDGCLGRVLRAGTRVDERITETSRRPWCTTWRELEGRRQSPSSQHTPPAPTAHCFGPPQNRSHPRAGSVTHHPGVLLLWPLLPDETKG